MLEWGLNDKGNGASDAPKRNYTKFEEGITKIRLLLKDGEKPHMRWTHWLPQFTRKITCPGRDCPIDALIKSQKLAKVTPTYSSSKSYSFNIWNYSKEQHEIMEEGITMVEGLLDFLVETFSDKDFTDEYGTDKGVSDIVIKVRKKKGTSGRFNWTFNLDSVSPMSETVKNAFDNPHDVVELTKAPSIEQVQQLLMVEAPSKEAYVQAYNEIMGYAKKENEDGNESELGIEVE